MDNVERRYLDVEVRTDINTDNTDKDKMIVEGYALKFNTKSNPLNSKGVRFTETIDPKALDNVDIADVRALIDHNPSLILARTTADTLKLEVDDVGLRFEAELADTSYARDLYRNIQAGNVNQCSFAFELNEKSGDRVSYNNETRMYERVLKSFSKINDISIVTYPAYNDTDVAPALRSIEAVKEEEADRLQEQHKHKLQLELDILRMQNEFSEGEL